MLATAAAARSGAGYVRLASIPGAVKIVAARCPEAIYTLCKKNSQGGIAGGEENLSLLLGAAQGADAIVTATGADQTNLIACQTARRLFGVKRTLSRVNDPGNLTVMKKLGVDVPVSSTDILARTLEREVDASAIQSLISLNRGEATISQFTLPEDSPLEGEAVKDLRLPAECVLISVTRRGELIIPRGPTKLQGGDQVLVLVGASATHQLMEALHLDENEEGEPEEAASHPQERQKWKIPWRKK